MAELLDELLARCGEGDRDAIATLVRRFRSYAMTFALRLTGDHHLAEDAVQEAFVVAFDRIGDLREPAAFPGWLRQIVRTHALRARRRHDASPDAPRARVAADTPAPDAEGYERRRIVAEAVAALPPRAREAAALYYLYALDHRQVAEVLGVPAGTVKRRLHDARRHLRDGLAGHLPL
jgi:RNA polymerase sigma factor (sigma-70 family)